MVIKINPKIDTKSFLRLIGLFMAVAISASVAWMSTTNGPTRYTTPVATQTVFSIRLTLVTLVAYTKNKDDLTYLQRSIRMHEFHRLYDIYNDYEGVNNIKTISKQCRCETWSGKSRNNRPDSLFKDWYMRTGGKVNIAMGPVLRIWHEYRQEGLDGSAGAGYLYGSPSGELRNTLILTRLL